MSDMLSEDMEIEILSRLSVTYLLRLRCVCKSWRALIKSPGFIRKHLQHNRELLEYGNAPLFATANDNRKPVLSWIPPSNVNHDEATLVEVPPNVDIDSLLLYDAILGPVNGIYCAIRRPVFHIKTINPDTRDSLFLCNPALREVKALPKVMCSKENYDDETTYGFGYDSKTEDFKVIAISESDYPPNCTRVFVFSLCSNSWRQIEYDVKSLPALPLKPKNAFFASHADGGGVVHWMLPDHILSFDFGKEVFRFSNLPNLGHPSTTYPAHYLAVLNESIHVILRKLLPCLDYYDVYVRHGKCVLDDGYGWEIWVMKEYGVKESWTKLYDTARIPLAFLPIGFRKNNKEILFDTMGTDRIVSYDPICNQSKILQTRAYKAFTYMESLVSIQ